MWWKTTSRRSPNAAAQQQTALDEAFLRRLERLALNASRTLRGGLSGTHPSMRRLPAPTFSDHRSYSPSDDLRYVDWNAYARHEHLHVKLGETEQDVPVHLLLDRSRSMDYGAGDTNKLHYGKLLVSAMGYLALAGGDKLTAAGFDTQPITPYGPVQSKAHALAMLRYMNALTPGATSAIGATVAQWARGRSGGMLVIVSDLWTVGDIDQMLRAVQPPRWQVTLLHLLHRDELQPPIMGQIELEDSEHGDRLSVDVDAQTLERYQQRLSQWCAAVETACAKRGAHYTRLISNMPIEKAVIPFLRERQVLRG